MRAGGQKLRYDLELPKYMYNRIKSAVLINDKLISGAHQVRRIKDEGSIASSFRLGEVSKKHSTNLI